MEKDKVETIAISKKLVTEIYTYLGTRPVREVNILYNGLAMEIDASVKAKKE